MSDSNISTPVSNRSVLASGWILTLKAKITRYSSSEGSAITTSLLDTSPTEALTIGIPAADNS